MGYQIDLMTAIFQLKGPLIVIESFPAEKVPAEKQLYRLDYALQHSIHYFADSIE